MNQGQDKFLNFIVERVEREHVDAARELLIANFKKQEEGGFGREDMLSTQEALMKMLKPEAVSEVQTAMTHLLLN